jgi:arylsulfatase
MLIAPPLLASVVAGGALAGKFARHRVESDLAEKMGAALPSGSAGIVAIYDPGKAGTVDTALAGCQKCATLLSWCDASSSGKA